MTLADINIGKGFLLEKVLLEIVLLERALLVLRDI